MQRKKIMACYRSVLSGLLALSVTGAAAQSPQAAAAAAPEEIVITGEGPMRERIMAAELKVYDLFNRFNDEKRFIVRCDRENVTGSHFKAQRCAPEYELAARREQAIGYQRSLGNLLGPFGIPDGSVTPEFIPVEAIIARHRPDYQRKMRQIAEEHPEFLQSLIEYSDLKQRFPAAATTEMDTAAGLNPAAE